MGHHACHMSLQEPLAGDHSTERDIAGDSPAGIIQPWVEKLLGHAFDAMLVVDRDASILGANGLALQLLGRTLDEVVGRKARDFIGERPQIDGDQPAHWVIRPDESRLGVSLRRCTGIVPHAQFWLLREATPEPALKAELERESRLLNESQEVGRSGSWELDMETGILRWTLGLCRLLEVADTATTMAIEQTFRYYSKASEKIVREAFEATLTRGVPYDLELEAVTARGKHLWIREVCRARFRDGKLVSLIGVLQDITERRRLSEYLARIADEERTRLGADLHDGLGQELTGFSLLLHALATRAKSESPSLWPELRHLSQMAGAAVASVRDIAHGMLPIALGHGDLKSAIRALANTTRRTLEVRVTTRYQCHNVRPSTGRNAEQLYRIAQEAVTNAVKHGRARRISIAVSEDLEQTSIVVADDGMGFDGIAAPRGMGLQIMHHRARVLGGLIDIQRSKLGGMQVTAVVPSHAGDRGI